MPTNSFFVAIHCVGLFGRLSSLLGEDQSKPPRLSSKTDQRITDCLVYTQFPTGETMVKRLSVVLYSWS